MRIPLLLMLFAVLIGPAGAQTVERVEIKGANALISVPQNWNGSLFIYAHGYTADKRLLAPIPDSDTLITSVLIPGRGSVPAGYATAMSTFRSVGWDVKDAIKDVENLRRYFVKKHGPPKHTYLWGHSEGGMITEAVIEYFPTTYDGAAPMCGTGAGGRRLFDGEYDLRVLFEYACRDVPAARFACGLCTDGTSRCFADGDCPAGQACSGTEPPPLPEDGLTPACTDFLLDRPDLLSTFASGGPFVDRVLTACVGGATPSPAEAARRDLLTRATQIPQTELSINLFFASIGLAEVLHRRTGGKRPWGNLGVQYTSPLLTAEEQAALNADVTGVHRSDSDAAAVRYLRRFYEPRGRTRSKIITLHALDDPLVIPEHEDKYREALVAAGRTNHLVQFFTPGGLHCGNFQAFPGVLEQLVGWVEQGQKPSPAAMNTECGNCLSPTRPGPFGLRVAERKQRGAPVRKLVCGGEAGDCPPGTRCSPARDHCE